VTVLDNRAADGLVAHFVSTDDGRRRGLVVVQVGGASPYDRQRVFGSRAHVYRKTAATTATIGRRRVIMVVAVLLVVDRRHRARQSAPACCKP